MVYGDPSHPSDVISARTITAVVPVDYQILGCPVSMPELVTVFKHILTGQEYRPPNEPVCVECKLNDNLCVFEKGLVCMGPLTRCGCNAVCTAYGDVCQGCRGLLDEANLKAAVNVLTADQLHDIMMRVARKHRFSEEGIRLKFAVYNNWPELKDIYDDAYQGPFL
jgi:coenzyme F420-reducing hydrogenase gamma subunit